MSTTERATRDANNVRQAFNNVARANRELARTFSAEAVQTFQAVVETYQEVSAAALRRCTEDLEYASVYTEVYSELTYEG